MLRVISDNVPAVDLNVVEQSGRGRGLERAPCACTTFHDRRYTYLMVIARPSCVLLSVGISHVSAYEFISKLRWVRQL
jgi:hypothetical protein